MQPGHPIRALVTGAGKVAARAFKAERNTIMRLARLSALESGGAATETGATAVLSDGSSVLVPLGDAIDLDRECDRLQSEHTRFEQLIWGQKGKLANQQFVSRAPAEVVERERRKLGDWQEQADVLRAKLERLGCLR